jgi:5-methylcytosine-specific restriction protein A
LPDLPKSHGNNNATRHKLPEQKRNSNAMGYTYRWQKFRESFLKKNPLCVECKKNGIVTVATDVDHIIPHRGDMKIFWQPGNHQALCRSHHSAKTARGE